MPKRKKKEVAEVKADETVTEAMSDTQEVPTLTASMDEVIEQAKERAERPPEEPREQFSHAERVQQRQPTQPDPFPFQSIALGDDRDSPRMRLYRNNKFQQFAIQFDEKPDEMHLDQLRDAGYRWRGGEDKVWTKQFMTKEERAGMDDQQIAARKIRESLEAEKLFAEIGNAIRAEKGLEPVGQHVGM